MKWEETNLAFIKSGYFNLPVIGTLALIGGLGFALFPFQDLSLEYMTNIYVLQVAVETALIIFAIVTWVMYISYRLDTRFNWHEFGTQRLLLQLLYGGILPFMGILLVVWYIYGAEVLRSETMHFVFALQMLFLYTVNERAYIIFLKDKKSTVKQQLLDHQERLGHMEAEAQVYRAKAEALEGQIRFLQEDHRELGQELARRSEHITALTEELATIDMLLDVHKQRAEQRYYKLKLAPGKVYSFAENQIVAFFVVGSKNNKPMIDLRSKDGQQMLTTESSLSTLEKKFDTMIRLNRQYLVSPDAITEVTETADGSAWIRLDFAEQPIEIKKSKWKIIGDKLRAIVATNKRHQSPSPDA